MKNFASSAATAAALLLATTTNVNALPSKTPLPSHEARDIADALKNGAKASWRGFLSSALGWYYDDVVPGVEGVLDESLSKAQTVFFDEPTKSVWQTLKDDDRFSILVNVTRHDEKIVKILDQASHGLTFFAPDNDAIKPPHKDELKDLYDITETTTNALAHLAVHANELFDVGCAKHHLRYGGDHDDDDKDKERKKKIFRAIVHAILQYHILPYDTTATDLGLNSTVPTALIAKDGSLGGQPRRIKVERTTVPPATYLNHYSSIKEGDVRATNGVIHIVDFPLFPLPDVLGFSFLLTKELSVFTTAVQKVDLEDAVSWHYQRESKLKGGFVGTPVVTGFIPSNEAFDALPDKLIAYLFSPFGKKALTKLLAYHLVFDYIVHSEWIYNHKKEKKLNTQGVEFEYQYDFPTGLKDHVLPISIKKTTPTIPIPGVAYWEFIVKGVTVEKDQLDIPVRNGALHIIDTVLDPRDHGDDAVSKDSWNDWEEWLPAWAAED